MGWIEYDIDIDMNKFIYIYYLYYSRPTTKYQL